MEKHAPSWKIYSMLELLLRALTFQIFVVISLKLFIFGKITTKGKCFLVLFYEGFSMFSTDLNER